MPFSGKTKPRGVRSLTEKADNDYSDVAANFSFAHVDGLYLEDVTVNDRSENQGPERRFLWAYDVHNVSLDNLRENLPIANTELPMFHLRDAIGVDISNCTPATDGTSFIRLEGEKIRKITLRNSDLRGASKVLEAVNGSNLNEVSILQNVE